MHKTYKTEGIILRRTNIGEADRLITIFSKRSGKINVIAKGVRRITSRRSAHLELFNHSLFVMHQGKTLDYVSDAQNITTFPAIRCNFELIGHAYFIVELLDRFLAERQENHSVYTHTVELLTTLNTVLPDTDAAGKLMHAFKVFLLTQLGFSTLEQQYDLSSIDDFIESIIERKLRSNRIFAHVVQ